MRTVPPARAAAFPRRALACLIAALALASVRPGTASAQEGPRWEYRVERVERVTKEPVVGPAQFISAAQLELRLNGFGAAGWELTEILEVPDGGVLLVYKRPVGGARPAAAVTPAAPAAPAAPAHPWAGRTSIAGQELLQSLQAGQVPIQVVDLRPTSAFGVGHVYGALSLPFAELDRRHAELRRDAALVLIDAGDGKAAGAANFLRNLGYAPVLVLEGGIAPWPGALVPGSR